MKKAILYPLIPMLLVAMICGYILLSFFSGNFILNFFFAFHISILVLIIDVIVIISHLLVTAVFKVDSSKKAPKYTTIMSLGIFAAVVIIFFSNPLMRSDEKTRADILKTTPLGMDREDVVKVIKSEYILHPSSYNFISSSPEKNPDIRILLGTYVFIFETSVSAHWKFDENLKLIDVVVRSDTDAL